LELLDQAVTNGRERVLATRGSDWYSRVGYRRTGCSAGSVRWS